MATYKQYSNSKGTFWQVRGYLGSDPATDKQVYTNKRGFKTKKEAQSYFNKALLDFEKEGIKKEPQKMTFEALYHE